LGEINTAKSEDTLENLLKDDDEGLRIKAASSLGKLGNDKGLDIAIEGVSSSDLQIRREAVLALTNIGVNNEEVKEALLKAGEDEDSRLKRRVDYAIQLLGIVIEEEKTEEKE
jgi:HEAT repeat protein